MKVGYARTSTIEQQAGLDAQLRDLKAAGCEEIFQEHVSSTAARPQFDAAITFVRKGDILVVTKIDRLARSIRHLVDIIDKLKAKDVSLQILNLGIDTSTPTGKLILTVLGGIGEFEREIMLERQREGIAKARASGKYGGRKPLKPDLVDQIKALRKEERGPVYIAKALGISRHTVRKYGG